MNKINLWIIAIVVLSAVAFAQQVVIGVEGTITYKGTAVKDKQLQFNVSGANNNNDGLTYGTPDINGRFSVLVGSQKKLDLTCGQQYSLQISVCSLDNNQDCYEQGTEGTWTNIGTYKFTACYGTTGDFNVAGTIRLTGAETSDWSIGILEDTFSIFSTEKQGSNSIVRIKIDNENVNINKLRVGGNTDGTEWVVGITGNVIINGKLKYTPTTTDVVGSTEIGGWDGRADIRANTGASCPDGSYMYSFKFTPQKGVWGVGQVGCRNLSE